MFSTSVEPEGSLPCLQKHDIRSCPGSVLFSPRTHQYSEYPVCRIPFYVLVSQVVAYLQVVSLRLRYMRVIKRKYCSRTGPMSRWADQRLTMLPNCCESSADMYKHPEFSQFGVGNAVPRVLSSRVLCHKGHILSRITRVLLINPRCWNTKKFFYRR